MQGCTVAYAGCRPLGVGFQVSGLA